MTTPQDDVLTLPPLRVFFRYALPWVAGMVMISSAGIVDAMFLGNTVGPDALAAITLALPSMTFVFGFGILFAVGASVRAGKYLGEGKVHAARAIFTKALVAVSLIAGLGVGLQLAFLESVVELLGGEGAAGEMAYEYLRIILPLLFFLAICVFFSYFVRVDNRPGLASLGMFILSIVNIVLDAIFVGWLGWGIQGAAWATGISYICGLSVLLTHFVFRKPAALHDDGTLAEASAEHPAHPTRRLALTRKIGSWREVLAASYNGISEFSNEVSAGLVVLIFNMAMLSEIGMSGVAALTVVNYLLFMTMIVCFGFSDSLQPLISKNYGAKQPARIAAFLRAAAGATLLIGLFTLVCLVVMPQTMVGIFLREQDIETANVAIRFTSIMWPTFVFVGMNITASAYFTAMHRPLHSALIAISRMLIFPVLYLLTLPLAFGPDGIFAAMPAAEITTFLLTLWLLRANRPSKLVAAAGD